MTILNRLLAWYQTRFVRKWPHCERFGFEIYINPILSDPDRLQNRVSGALEYLRDRHPDAFGQLRQYVGRIVVRPGGYSSHWSSTRACLLDQQLLEGTFPAYAVASFLVSVAAHARMPRLKFTTPHSVRKEVARRAIDEQIAIARAEPGSERFVEWLTAYGRH